MNYISGCSASTQDVRIVLPEIVPTVCVDKGIFCQWYCKVYSTAHNKPARNIDSTSCGGQIPVKSTHAMTMYQLLNKPWLIFCKFELDFRVGINMILARP